LEVMMILRPLTICGPRARWLLAPCALGLAVALAAGILQATGGGAGRAVYTVAQLRAHLHRDPAAWVGRTLWVRGRIAGCPGILPPAAQSVCREWDRYYLTDTAAPATEPLPVERENPDPLLAALRRLPLGGRLLPAEQQIHWGMLTTYRVRVRVAPALVCRRPPCYEALLLDAAP
jgi:hypothetical protein